MIKAIDAAQGDSPQEPPCAELAARAEPVERVEELSHDEKSSLSPDQPSRLRQIAESDPKGEAENPKSEILHPKSEVPLLTPEEKRRILARIARVNPLDCFDESGVFDIVKAKRILPPGMVRHIAVHETTRLNAEGQPVTQRRIHVRLVDPVSALRLDDQLERRRERSTSSSTSPSEPDPNSPPPHPASPEYAHNLLRKNTIALDEAQHTLAQLKKALAEKEERKRQLSQQLDEKDQQLSKTLSLSNGSETLSPSNGSETLSPSNGSETLSPSNGSETLSPSNGLETLSLSNGSKTLSPSSASKTLSPVEGQRSLALQSRDHSQEAGFSTPLSGKSETQNSSNPTLPNRAASTQRDTGCQPVEVRSLLERETGCQPVNPKNQTPPQAPSSSSLALQSRDQSREAGFSTPLTGQSETQNSSNPTLKNRAASSQRDTGCQPVEVRSLLERETGCQPVNPKNQTQPQALSEVEGTTLSSVKDPHSATKPSSSQPPRKFLDELPYHELPRRKQEIEDRRTTSSPTAFAAWLKATAVEPPGYRSGAPRPPPQYHPMSLHAQGMPKEVR